LEFFGFLLFLAACFFYGILVLCTSLLIRPVRRWMLPAFFFPTAAIGLLGLVTTLLLDNACGSTFAIGPDGEQDFQYCASTWPSKAVFPLWIASTALAWVGIYLVQRWLNRKRPFFGAKDLPGEPSKTHCP
jgi:hypothetical protein